MLGAIIGDIVGSTREWHNVKSEDFELIPSGSHFTDDSVMTLAVAQWLMRDAHHKKETLIECMQYWGRRYPHAGYGGMFHKWLLSHTPQPYGSYGNGSAMRVSAVGMYANSLEEAMELARITAEVTHNHPDGIKGAQAIAACVYLKMNGREDEIKRFVEETFGYYLDGKLDEIRETYTFDATCGGSVPIAIMAYLQRMNMAEGALRLAISMGGDSDTIGCMTCAIAHARPFYIVGGGISSAVETQCRQLLPPDLLDINDQFEAFISHPLNQSFGVQGNGIFFAGEYPGDKEEAQAQEKVNRMVHFGVRHFIDLTEEHELKPYSHLLPRSCTYERFPIKDVSAPKSVDEVSRLLNRLDELQMCGGYVYLHCRGGVGRTGTIVACHLARTLRNATLEDVLVALRRYFADMPKSAYRKVPETQEQILFVKRFLEHISSYQNEERKRILDCIRGSLMAGAAGDALGYPVEFFGRQSILSKYGNRGITHFDLDKNGKALVSDDTQMTLFTANGLLAGLTRGYMRGVGGQPEKYVDMAYVDWYYTQTGLKGNRGSDDFHFTWLRDLPQLAHRRAPGNTCMSACDCITKGTKVQNNSKGCGGIMRVAPMALLAAGYMGRRQQFYNAQKLATAGAEIAMTTHKHPLGFLPAAMLTHLLFTLVPISVEEAKARIDAIVEETIDLLGEIYKGEYEEEKRFLADLTRRAVHLAHSTVDDAVAIGRLGEGWNGDEAWAIALYCAMRHIDSVEDAIIAAVNHDGDSDSTGSVTGNIMGAIYGYEAIKEKRLFCPAHKELEETLELSNIILALADDLNRGCIISEYDTMDTPEKKQWYERYCEMMSAGIQ